MIVTTARRPGDRTILSRLVSSVVFCCLPLVLSGCTKNMVVGEDLGTIVASSDSVDFGAVSIGQTASATVTVSNRSSAPVQITQLNLTGQPFSIADPSTLPVTLAAGKTYSLNLQFDPTIAGAATGQLAISSNSSTNATAAISLSGTGTPMLSGLSCTNASMTGAGMDGCTVTLNAAAASGGLIVSLSSSSIAVTVPKTVTVAANATSAGFTATISSVATAPAVTLTASAGSISKSFDLQLNAEVPILSINATSVAFGNVNVNTAATQSMTLTSTGTAAVTISAATLTGTGFTMPGAIFPLTLSPGKTATLNLQFEPVTAGTATGQLAITSNSSTKATTEISLSGTGIAESYAVNLSWDAPSSSSDPIAGYNVYRAAAGSSKYALLNSSVVTETSYVDDTVQSGLTYDFIVESVDDSGVESSPSNMIALAIP